MDDITEVIKFRNWLSDLMHERFRQATPTAYQAATGVANLLAEVLPADRLATFFRVAVEAEEESRQPARFLAGTYSDCLDRGLGRAFKDLYEDDPGLNVAWHLGRVFPNLLPRGEFTPFIQLAQKALERAAALPAS
ncbi:hypothetical protein [Kitasatospora sp. NBC_01302]|uniref:hypothetical protein n=1 Tax=Kitasatospora sp. NBC_01302 TaxID=2903575 RepID=UPI002E108F64|nr:hypothetical protein OG294_40185 [Kitasatospora sp. NBC_01302]